MNQQPQFPAMPPTPEATWRQRTMRRSAMIAGGTAVALAAGVGGAVIFSPDTTPGPTASGSPEIEPASGEIDMSALSNRLTPAEKTAAADLDNQQNGYPTVPLVRFSYDRTAPEGHRLIPQKMSEALDSDGSQAIESAVNHNAPLLSYLYESGKIETINFSVSTSQEEMGSDGDMRRESPTVSDGGTYTPGAIVYVLPPTGNVTSEAMSVMTSHEATHLVQRRFSAVDQFDIPGTTEIIDGGKIDTDNKAYATYCEAIRTASINGALHDQTVIEAAKEVVSLQSPNQADPINDHVRIAQSILDGTFASLQPRTSGAATIAKFTVPECRTDAPTYITVNQQTAAGKPSEVTDSLKPPLIALDTAFKQSINSISEPLGVFKESNYLHTSPADGHPGDNTAEFLTSAANVAYNYPTQVAENINNLPAAIRPTMVKMLQQITNDTVTANQMTYGSELYISTLQTAVNQIASDVK